VKRTCIRQLPHTLCVHLKRFEFDFHTQTRYKVRDRFEFPHTIDMFRYTVDGLALQEQQAAAEGAPSGSVSGAGAARRSSATGGASSSSLLGGEAPAGQQDLYDLKGVVVHMGSAFTGHYYSYIKERPHWRPDGTLAEGSWLCFDDKQVNPWSINQLEQDCFGGRAAQDSNGGAGGRLADMDRSHSAYMLFYERRSEQAQDADALTSATPHQQAAPTAGGGEPAAATAAATAAAAAAATGGVGYAGGGDPASGGAAAMEVSPRPSVTGPGPTTAAPEAAAAGGGGSGAPEDMDISVPDAAAAAGGGGEGAAPASAADAAPGGNGAGAAAGFVAPYGLPLSLYSRVMNENIHMVWLRHVFDRDYFRFIRALLCHSEAGHATSKKSRRKEPGSDPAAAAAAGGAPGSQPAAAGEAAGDAAQQQQADPQQRAALGPSGSSRVEQEVAAGLLLTELGLRFSFDIFLHAANHLKGEVQVWQELVTAPLRGSADCLLLALGMLSDRRHYADMAFRARFHSISEAGREFASKVLETTLYSSVNLVRAKQQELRPWKQPLQTGLADLMVRLSNSIEHIGHEELEVNWNELGRVLYMLLKVGQHMPTLQHTVLNCTSLIGALVMLLADSEQDDPMEDQGPLDMHKVYHVLRCWLADCENWPNLVSEFNQQPQGTSPFYNGDGCPHLSVTLGQDGHGFTISSDVFTVLMDQRLLTRLVHDVDPTDTKDPAVGLLELLVWGNLTASERVMACLRTKLWSTLDPEEVEEYALTVRRLVLLSGNKDDLQGQRAWALFFQPAASHNNVPVPLWTYVVHILSGRRTEADEAAAIILLRLLSELCRSDTNIASRMNQVDAMCQLQVITDLVTICNWLRSGPLTADEARDIRWLYEFGLAVWRPVMEAQQQQQDAVAAAAAGDGQELEGDEIDEVAVAEGGQAGLGGHGMGQGSDGEEEEEEEEELPEDEEEEEEEEEEDSLQENNR
jgi:hypothetical protein